ncbi:hypothetical protein Nepgr_013662 [Nepenthes gracilis]|uniref:Protein BIG GRAIN 1-like A n=1 Tax=Nepenthes gracilis TaxID=150966 RepID=A0AAD3XPK2_NEPGR|nr:hypothetical protein Nepgr_013662 [Nepenthes gracilis]
MHKREKSSPQDRCKHHPRNPSFSSTLLDEIYRSIDAEQGQDLGFYSIRRGHGELEEEKMPSSRRACLTEKWMERKSNEKVIMPQRPQQQRRSDFVEELEGKTLEHEAVIPFSNTSSSSDSSFGGFSSSETESYTGGSKLRASSFAPPRPKPVRTSIPTRATKSSTAQQCGHRESETSEDYGCGGREDSKSDETVFRSKSRALKIYCNLKNLKQPISPGIRFTSFINSLFAKESSKKATKSLNLAEGCNYIRRRNFQSEPTSTCSSASSFSRTCLMGKSNFPSNSAQKLGNGNRRSVRFYPVSVIVDEDSRPCGHKSLYKDDGGSLMSTNISAAKLGRALSKRYEELRKLNEIEKERELDGFALGLLKGYSIEKEDDGHARNALDAIKGDNQDDRADNDYDDVDRLSCSSSDLFELDHLSITANEELPIYETTRFVKDESLIL